MLNTKKYKIVVGFQDAAGCDAFYRSRQRDISLNRYNLSTNEFMKNNFYRFFLWRQSQVCPSLVSFWIYDNPSVDISPYIANM